MNENKSPIIQVENLDGTPIEPETMTFTQAIDQIINGHVITKLEWNNKDIFCLLKAGTLQIHIDNEFKNWIISDGDMVGTDWIIIA